MSRWFKYLLLAVALMLGAIEAVDKSFDGITTQEDVRVWMGGDPDVDPLVDLDTWNAYTRYSGHSLSGETNISKESTS